MTGIEGVEEVLIDQASGEVQVRCAAGTELTRAQVAEAVGADPKFKVTEFAMHTPEAAGDEADEVEAPQQDGE